MNLKIIIIILKVVCKVKILKKLKIMVILNHKLGQHKNIYSKKLIYHYQVINNFLIFIFY